MKIIAHLFGENGALPFTCCEHGVLDCQIAQKTVHYTGTEYHRYIKKSKKQDKSTKEI